MRGESEGVLRPVKLPSLDVEANFRQLQPTGHSRRCPQMPSPTSIRPGQYFERHPLDQTQQTAKMSKQYENISNDLIWEITRTSNPKEMRYGMAIWEKN